MSLFIFESNLRQTIPGAQVFVFMGMKDKHSSLSHFFSSDVRRQATQSCDWPRSPTRVEFNEQYETTLQSEKELAFLNVPIIQLHFSKLLNVHQQGRREGEVNADLL